jgi:diguanylate cyclase (GGDEF)-like protein
MSDLDSGAQVGPSNLEDLTAWIREHVDVPAEQKEKLLADLERVFDRQRDLWRASKLEAVQALSAGFAQKLGRLQSQLTAKEATVRNLSRYFEDVVAGLTDKANRDPKTRLMNFEWFMQRFESFLAIEQRVRWCGVGIADITSFKWFNDHLGHAVGDLIIEQVAKLLAEQLRSRDLLAQDSGPHDLHARFGGDEFAFLIPDLPGSSDARRIAERFKRHVEQHPWGSVDPRLEERGVQVDVGVVALRLGSLDERRGAAKALAGQLIDRADQLMYGAKTDRAHRVYLAVANVRGGRLVEETPAERGAPPDPGQP